MSLVALDELANTTNAQCAHLSELDRFILTRYDPLLQIVRQLTSKINEVESLQNQDAVRIEKAILRIDGLSQLHKLEGAVANNASEMKLHGDRCTARFDRLEAAVSELNSRVEVCKEMGGFSGHGDQDTSNKDLYLVFNSLAKCEARTARLEAAFSALESSGCLNQWKLAAKKQDSIMEKASNMPVSPVAERSGDGSVDMSAPWLFKVSAVVSIATIQSALGFDEPSTFTVELDAYSWASEFHMWCEVASSLAEVNPRLAEKQGNHSPDHQVAPEGTVSVDVLKECKQSAVRGLALACMTEVLLVIRSVPGKDELAASAAVRTDSGIQSPGSCGSAQSRIRCVAALALEAQRQWELLSESQPIEELGRLSMVLVGNGIGHSLRAGIKKFRIESLL